MFFSEGFEGAIGLSSEFQRKFDELKDGTIWENKILDDYLGESIYLSFDSDGIENESNKGEFAFIDGWTQNTVAPDKLKVCILENKKTGEVSYQRDDIVKYMMKSIGQQEFLKYDNDIQERISNYYNLRQNDLNNFNQNDYELQDMDLKEFCDLYINKEKKKDNPWILEKDELIDIDNSIRNKKNINDIDIER